MAFLEPPSIFEIEFAPWQINEPYIVEVASAALALSHNYQLCADAVQPHFNFKRASYDNCSHPALLRKVSVCLQEAGRCFEICVQFLKISLSCLTT